MKLLQHQDKKTSPKGFPQHHSGNSMSFESLFHTGGFIGDWEKQRLNSHPSTCRAWKTCWNWVSLSRDPQNQLYLPAMCK